jgi:hypothetical protein
MDWTTEMFACFFFLSLSKRKKCRPGESICIGFSPWGGIIQKGEENKNKKKKKRAVGCSHQQRSLNWLPRSWFYQKVTMKPLSGFIGNKVI